MAAQDSYIRELLSNPQDLCLGGVGVLRSSPPWAVTCIASWTAQDPTLETVLCLLTVVLAFTAVFCHCTVQT